MTYIDPNLDQNAAGKKVAFAGMVVLVGLFIYFIVDHIQNLPRDNTPQTASQKQESALQSGAAAMSNMREITLGFRVGGRIAQMNVAEHAQVKQGDVLATLDKVPFEEALAAARAQLQVAQADYNKPPHLTDGAFKAVEEARANVETAQNTYDEAHAELIKRRGQLVVGQLDHVYDDDVQDERDAELNLQKMRRELAHQEETAGVATDRATSAASVQAAQANVALAETNLADAQIVAPASGTIASRQSEPGATVAAGATVYVIAVPVAAGAVHP